MMETKQPSFEEHLRAPGWMFALLGLMLGVWSGALTAVAIFSLRSDPLLSGAEAFIFFVSFAAGMAIIVYVMLNSTLMSIIADAHGLHVRLGILGAGRNWAWKDITSSRATAHSTARHGGRGSIFAPSGRRSWSMFGIGDGVELEIADGSWCFVSSQRGEDLTDVIAERLSN